MGGPSPKYLHVKGASVDMCGPVVVSTSSPSQVKGLMVCCSSLWGESGVSGSKNERENHAWQGRMEGVFPEGEWSLWCLKVGKIAWIWVFWVRMDQAGDRGWQWVRRGRGY